MNFSCRKGKSKDWFFFYFLDAVDILLEFLECPNARQQECAVIIIRNLCCHSSNKPKVLANGTAFIQSVDNCRMTFINFLKYDTNFDGIWTWAMDSFIGKFIYFLILIWQKQIICCQILFLLVKLAFLSVFIVIFMTKNSKKNSTYTYIEG